MTITFHSHKIVVDAGQRAVIFDKFRGLQETPVGEGTHFRIPFVQVRLFTSAFMHMTVSNIIFSPYRKYAWLIFVLAHARFLR